MLSILSAPTNLGLRPPEPGGTPGTAKAPEALRAAGLWEALGGQDAGVVLPGRYVDDDATRTGPRLRNHDAVLDHATRLAERLRGLMAAGGTPVVVGGDCSLLLGIGLALRGSAVGLVHVDGHTDFRHPGDSNDCSSLAGEDLAAAVGRHWPDVAHLGGPGPAFPPDRVAHVGCREDDDHLDEVRSTIGACVTSAQVAHRGATVVAAEATLVADREEGYWVQVDVDVLDPVVMPAVDSPAANGLSTEELAELLSALAPRAIGVSLTVFDPDLDPDGSLARLLVSTLAPALRRTGEWR